MRFLGKPNALNQSGAFALAQTAGLTYAHMVARASRESYPDVH
jgi:hypothetical protein